MRSFPARTSAAGPGFAAITSRAIARREASSSIGSSPWLFTSASGSSGRVSIISKSCFPIFPEILSSAIILTSVPRRSGRIGNSSIDCPSLFRIPFTSVMIQFEASFALPERRATSS